MQLSTQLNERIESLDALRGLAVLGILAMNIVFFAMPQAVYMNPVANGAMDATSQSLWIANYAIFAEKFYALFSALFGAGIAMMAERAARNETSPTGLHYRRMFWLMMFGLLHGYVLWSGDILFVYSVCGMLVYLLRNLTVFNLIAIGLIANGLLALLMMLMGLGWEHMTPEQMADIQRMMAPDAQQLADEARMQLGSWWEQTPLRVETTFHYQIGFVVFSVFRMGGIMLLGMALYKSGVLTAARSAGFYLVNALVFIALGWFISYQGAMGMIASDFDLKVVYATGGQYNYWAALITAWGYLCGMMLLVKQRHVIARTLIPVGRMAFTNYLTQSIIGAFLFYGWGLGWYNSMSRAELWIVVATIWVVQIIWSHLWLKSFRYGPFEWAWRSLSYRSMQPMRR